ADDRTGTLDLGATWFWDGEHRVRACNVRLGVPTFAQYTAGSALVQDGTGTHRLPGNPLDVPAYRYATGADTLTRRLADTLPAHALHLDTPVTSIRRVDGGLEVSASGTRYRADHVVLAVPPALAVRRIDFGGGLAADMERLAADTPVWMGA